jgi:hypothetical protein
MRRGHRRAHRLIWIVLLPLLLIGLTMALALRPPPDPQEAAQEAGK